MTDSANARVTQPAQTRRTSRRKLLWASATLATIPLALGAAWAARRAYNAHRLRAFSGRRVYDDTGTGVHVVRELQERAAREKKRALVVLGGDWCQWCLALDDLFHENASIAALLRSKYVVAKLDADSNDELVARWNEPTRGGVPVLIFLDGTGAAAHVQEAASLELFGGRLLRHDSGAVFAILERWARP